MNSNNYFEELSDLLLKIEIKDQKGKGLLFNSAVRTIVNFIIAQHKNGNKVILIGNGGSASVAGHIATDLLKNARVGALAFNDSSLLTCISNDLGYEHVFEKPIGMLAEKGDILFAISSSGKSKNILNGVTEAKEKGCFLITLSGFAKDNPLRKTGDINFYFPSDSYGYTEIAHLAICHCIVDKLIETTERDG